jgi:hypothetical protein
MTSPHGTISKYNNERCRCDQCRTAIRNYRRNRRRVEATARRATARRATARLVPLPAVPARRTRGIRPSRPLATRYQIVRASCGHVLWFAADVNVPLGGWVQCPQHPLASIGIVGTGNADLLVYGVGTINGCPSTQLSGSSSAQSTAGTYVVAPATCAGITPPCSVVSGKFSDPYASLITNGTLSPPSTAGCTGGPNPGTVSAGHYGPNTYPRALSVNNVTFDPGTYVFCNGLDVNGTVTGNGVTFYFAAGAIVSVNNNAVFTLSKPTSGPYSAYGLTVWQAPGDATASDSCCSNNIVINIFGTYYAPSARVSFKNGTVHLDQVIAVGLDLPGGGGTNTIGDIPIITSLSPSSRGQGATSQNITINGANFVAGGSLASSFGAGITVNSTVTNGNGRVGTKVSAFTVNAGPGAVSVNPSTLGHGISSNVAITGSGFVNGAGLDSDFGAGVTVNSTTWVSATQVTANITVTPGAALGSRSVTVTNPDGGSATANNAFSVVAPTILSVSLNNKAGQTAGTIETGDTIVIQVSSEMDESDFCSTWTNDAQDQSLSVNGTVVNLADGTGVVNDSITLAAPAADCASGFHLDSIDLGSNAYISGGGAAFGTTGNGNRATFAWNHATHTLTITLGVRPAGGGTVANVLTSTPSYTGSVTDSGGAALANSPFPVPAGKKF